MKPVCGMRQGRVGAEAIQQISRKLVAPCGEAEEVILDVDATEIETEKQDAQWTYHQVQGYMPLVGYVDGATQSFCSIREEIPSRVDPGFWTRQ